MGKAMKKYSIYFVLFFLSYFLQIKNTNAHAVVYTISWYYTLFKQIFKANSFKKFLHSPFKLYSFHLSTPLEVWRLLFGNIDKSRPTFDSIFDSKTILLTRSTQQKKDQG